MGPFHNHIKNKEEFKNTLFITDLDKIVQKVSEYKEKYKRLQIIVHYNNHHEQLYQTIYEKFKDNIKIVHIYEDSSMYMWWKTNKNLFIFKEKGIKKNLHMWGDINVLCSGDNPSPNCLLNKFNSQEIRIVPVNFHNLQKKLSNSDKQTIFKLAGFDFQKYKKLLSKKPNGIYILGVARWQQFEGSQLAALKDACQSTPNFQWYYKPHPNRFFIPTEKVLNHFCPNIKELDAHIPFELLIIGGLKPTKIAGAASSLFANVNKDDILYYIQRDKRDEYLHTLKKSGQLTDDKIYTYEKTINKLNELDIFRVDNPNPNDYWIIKMDPSKVCVMHTEKCGKLIEETSTKRIIKWDNGNITKLKYMDKYNWEEIK